VGALRDEDKPALLDEQQELKDAQATWGGTTGVLAAIGFAIAPALIAVPLAVGAVSVAVLKRKQNAVERLLADPPRFDYETSTRARRRRYETGALGEGQLAAATDQVAISTLRAAAYFEASVRADERSQGARITGRDELVTWHLEEARRLFELGKRWSGEMAATFNAMSVFFTAAVLDAGLDEAPLPDQVRLGELPAPAREALRSTGLVVPDLDPAVVRVAEARVERRPGLSTVGDLAFDSAMKTRALTRSADKVAAGARALPARTFERQLPAAANDERLAFESRERGDLEMAQQYFLRAVEGGSTDAMFELGALAHETGDRERAREWLDRAAAQSASMVRIDLKEIEEWSDSAQLPPPPKRLEG
jgi:TPR repeat protein